jgi:glycine cleavage system pyridoxal-binding protein P
MVDNVQSLMFEILKQIQADVAVLKADVSVLKTDGAGVKADVADIRTHVERLEDLAKRQRRDTAAILVMMRGVAGVFDERLRDVENEVRVMMERD